MTAEEVAAIRTLPEVLRVISSEHPSRDNRLSGHGVNRTVNSCGPVLEEGNYRGDGNPHVSGDHCLTVNDVSDGKRICGKHSWLRAK